MRDMALALAPPPAALTAKAPAIHVHGAAFLNAAGHRVVLRGVNVDYRSFLVKQIPSVGARFVRIRVFWNLIEPSRGTFSTAQLKMLDAAVQMLQSHRINMELDLRVRPQPSWFADRAGFYTSRAAASHAAYLPFVNVITRRYRHFPRVIGFGIVNEPSLPSTPHGTPRLDQQILRWQAPVRNAIAAQAPGRAIFFNVRGGNYGTNVCFSCAGFKLRNAVLDWHSFYNGCCGDGMDARADNWLPSWGRTHNQRSSTYTGTYAAQRANLMIPYQRTRARGIPMIVGEWGVHTVPGWRSYDQQMRRLLTALHLSFARWDMSDSPHFGLATGTALNDQGRWLQAWLTARR